MLRGYAKFVRQTPVSTSLILMLFICAIEATVLLRRTRTSATVVSVLEIKPSNDLSLLGRLSNPDLSAHQRLPNARLYMIEQRRGTRLHYFDGWCQDSYACSWFNALLDA